VWCVNFRQKSSKFDQAPVSGHRISAASRQRNFHFQALGISSRHWLFQQLLNNRQNNNAEIETKRGVTFQKSGQAC
jgi:hypothetical protein